MRVNKVTIGNVSKQLDRPNYIVLDTDKRPTTTEELEEREMNRRGAPSLYPGKWHPRSDLRAKLSTGYMLQANQYWCFPNTFSIISLHKQQTED